LLLLLILIGRRQLAGGAMINFLKHPCKFDDSANGDATPDYLPIYLILDLGHHLAKMLG